MEQKVYTIKIAGPAGLGIKSGGQLISRILIKHGFNVRDYNEYPSLVRGGHNMYQVSFSEGDIFAPHYLSDLFFSIHPEHWRQHVNEFHDQSLIFSDEEFNTNPAKGNYLKLPLKDLAEKAGSSMSTNIICIGVAAYILGLDMDLIKDTIVNDFGKNTDTNISALELGYYFAKTNYENLQIKIKLPKNKVKLGHNFNDGNEAFGWGFIKGKGNFYAAYPMTPSTGVLHFLAPRQEDFKMTIVHPEDEIAAANMAAGAAFAGARAATGTSGGGFALMNEAVSYCGVSEIGLVYYLVSRPGPATGLPTWTAQGDLLYAVNSGHGEFPKVVLAPGDVQESFDTAVESLNLAAQLQTPVIVISDKFIAESSSNTTDLSQEKVKVETSDIASKVADGFKRYSFETKTGISALTLPGTPKGEFLANSYEHDENGFSTEDPNIVDKMSQKRMDKMKTALKLAPKPNFYGDKKSKKLIISWGSTKGVILEALKTMKNKEDYAFLQLKTLWPINPDLKIIIDAYKEVIVIENNYTSQLTTLLKSQFDFNPAKIITKGNGRPFFPEELYDQLN